MFNVGDKVRVIRGIGRVLPVGFEDVLEDNQPRNNRLYVRFRNADGVPTVYLADRFELVEAAPVAVVAPPPQEPHVFQQGDVVRIVFEPVDWLHYVPDMAQYIDDGVEYTLNRVDRGDDSARIGQTDYWWPFSAFQLVRVAGAAEPVPAQAAIIAPVAPPAKQGPIAYEDVVPGMKAVLVKINRNDGSGIPVGTVVTVDGHYDGLREAFRVSNEELGFDRVAVYRENYHHYNEAPKEIVVGGSVLCVEGYQDKLTQGAIYVVRKINEENTISVVGVPGLYAKRRFVPVDAAAAPVVEEPAKVVDIKTIARNMWVKVVGFAGVHDEMDHMVGDGKFYQVSSVDHDDERAQLREHYRSIPWSALELYDKRGKDVPVPVAKRPKMDLQERFKLKQGGKYHGGLTSLAWESVYGEQGFNMSGACYADFGSNYGTKRSYSKLIIGALPMQEQILREGELALDNFKTYAKYILNESPWAPCFITKDFDKGVEEGIVLDVTKTLSQATGAAVALRQGHEYYQPVLTFSHLLEKGYSGNVAFLVSMVARRTKDNHWEPTTMGNGHQAIQSNARATKLIEFFAKGFQDYGDVPCTQNKAAYALFKAIEPKPDHKGESLDSLFARLVKKTTVGEGWGAKVSVKQDEVYAFADTIANMIKEQQV